MILKENGTAYKTKYYVGAYEKEITPEGERELHYIGGSAIYVTNSDGSSDMYYIYKDHLGSITDITDDEGTVVESLSYDACGNRRNPNTWEYDNNLQNFLFDRGFTGHEHLDDFAIINMNGRIYDPLTGRMMAPDNFVQSSLSQNLNRYSYCLNNPLVYTDPSGELAWFVPVIVGAVAGSYIGGAVTSDNWNPISKQYWQDGWEGAIVGGLLGATAGAIFSAAMAPTALGSASGFHTTGMVVGGEATAGWGITTTSLQSSSINIGLSYAQGQGVEEAWKAGVVGAASGAWTATGGLGLVKKGLLGKLAYQNIGLTSRSIGQNWVAGGSSWEELTQRVVIGTGPVNLNYSREKGITVDWRDNIGNIVVNSIGMLNLATGGNMSFDWNNLTPSYSGGVLDKVSQGAVGAHAILGDQNSVRSFHSHELHHVWQSRSLGDMFLPIYAGQSLFSIIMGQSPIGKTNYFETQAYGYYWWR
jgi:RHS repeat-associated protein